MSLPEKPRIAIVGAGAVGCYYGGKLAALGHDVRFLMRSDLAAVRENGLVLWSAGEGETKLPVRACATPEEIGPVDLVLIALKATANAALDTLIPPLLHETTALVTLQNGLGNEALLAERFGESRVLGALCFVCLNRVAPGRIEHYGHGTISIGEYLRPPQPRTHGLVAMFRQAGVEAKVVENLMTERWRKLVWNIPFNGLSIAAGGVTTDRILSDPALEPLARGLMRETLAIAAAQGHAIPASYVDFQMERTVPMGPYKPSSLVDYLAGRPVEVEAIWGEAWRAAQAAGVEAGRLEALYLLLRYLVVKNRGPPRRGDLPSPSGKYRSRARPRKQDCIPPDSRRSSPPIMSKPRSGCFWALTVLVGLALFCSLLLNLALVAGRTKAMGAKLAVSAKPIEKLEERMLTRGSETELIAHIPLRGLISSSIGGRIGDTMVSDVKIQLRQAVNDPKIKAIVLAIDSPGGEVTASDILYKAIVQAREKKPVVVSMGSMAASGGYYAACGGSYLMANETTFTGSIGVIIQAFRYNDLLGKIGVQPETFKSGAFKDMLSGTRELTPQEREYVQSLVMQTYARFVGIVAAERKLPEEELRSGVADGRVVTGKDALAAKLVDALGGIEDAYEKARELGGAPNAAVVAYEEPFRLGRLFRFFGSEAKVPGRVEINLSTLPLLPLEPGRAYLLPSLCVP